MIAGPGELGQAGVYFPDFTSDLKGSGWAKITLLPKIVVGPPSPAFVWRRV